MVASIISRLNREATFRQPVRYCTMLGCRTQTKDGKPFCVRHVEHCAYVVEVQRKIDQREQEIADVKRGRGSHVIKRDSIVINDLLLTLKIDGSRTVAKLARDDNRLDKTSTEVYARQMRKFGLVSMMLNERRKWVVHAMPNALPDIDIEIEHDIDDA